MRGFQAPPLVVRGETKAKVGIQRKIFRMPGEQIVGDGVTGGVEVGGGSHGACESGKMMERVVGLGCYGLVLV